MTEEVRTSVKKFKDRLTQDHQQVGVLSDKIQNIELEIKESYQFMSKFGLTSEQINQQTIQSTSLNQDFFMENLKRSFRQDNEIVSKVNYKRLETAEFASPQIQSKFDLINTKLNTKTEFNQSCDKDNETQNKEKVVYLDYGFGPPLINQDKFIFDSQNNVKSQEIEKSPKSTDKNFITKQQVSPIQDQLQKKVDDIITDSSNINYIEQQLKSDPNLDSRIFKKEDALSTNKFLIQTEIAQHKINQVQQRIQQRIIELNMGLFEGNPKKKSKSPKSKSAQQSNKQSPLSKSPVQSPANKSAKQSPLASKSDQKIKDMKLEPSQVKPVKGSSKSPEKKSASIDNKSLKNTEQSKASESIKSTQETKTIQDTKQQAKSSTQTKAQQKPEDKPKIQPKTSAQTKITAKTIDLQKTPVQSKQLTTNQPKIQTKTQVTQKKLNDTSKSKSNLATTNSQIQNSSKTLNKNTSVTPDKNTLIVDKKSTSTKKELSLNLDESQRSIKTISKSQNHPQFSPVSQKIDINTIQEELKIANRLLQAKNEEFYQVNNLNNKILSQIDVILLNTDEYDEKQDLESKMNKLNDYIQFLELSNKKLQQQNVLLRQKFEKQFFNKLDN